MHLAPQVMSPALPEASNGQSAPRSQCLLRAVPPFVMQLERTPVQGCPAPTESNSALSLCLGQGLPTLAPSALGPCALLPHLLQVALVCEAWATAAHGGLRGR